MAVYTSPLPKAREPTPTWVTLLHVAIHVAGFVFSGSKGRRSGESARLPPLWPGFKSRRGRHVWVEFVVGSLICSGRFFSGHSGFPLSSKTNISKFQFHQQSGRRRTTLWMCYLQIIIYLLIYLFIYLFMSASIGSTYHSRMGFVQQGNPSLFICYMMEQLNDSRA